MAMVCHDESFCKMKCIWSINQKGNDIYVIAVKVTRNSDFSWHCNQTQMDCHYKSHFAKWNTFDQQINKEMIYNCSEGEKKFGFFLDLQFN